MSRLSVFPEREPAAPARDTAHPAAIAGELAAWGVRFERWSPVASHDDPRVAYAPRMEGMSRRLGSVDEVAAVGASAARGGAGRRVVAGASGARGS